MHGCKGMMWKQFLIVWIWYKIGIHPALLDSRFKHTHNCSSARLLSTIPAGTKVMALSAKFLWNKQPGSNNMHHQICISQTQIAKLHIHTHHTENIKCTFKTSTNAWLQESDVEAVVDCLKYKVGIHPVLLAIRFKHTHNCSSAGLLSTIPTGMKLMALEYKCLWNEQSGSKNMHHQICISQTTYCEATYQYPAHSHHEEYVQNVNQWMVARVWCV